MECHAYDHGMWQSHYVQFLNVIQNWLNNVADVIPHCAKVVHFVPNGEKDVINIPAINIIKAKLEKDVDLPYSTSRSIPNIIILLPVLP